MSYTKKPILDSDGVAICLGRERYKLNKKYKKMDKILTKEVEIQLLKEINCGNDICPLCYACSCIHTDKGRRECISLAVYIW